MTYRIRPLLASAVIFLAGCAGMPAQDVQQPPGSPQVGTGATAGTRVPKPAQGQPPAAQRPDTTFTLPTEKRISLATYRTQIRTRLMQTEGANADVADCAAHASWVVPRSASFDALKIPSGALGADQAQVMPWSERFSPVKQAVKVSSVVLFDAQGHQRGATDTWLPIKVRCGYKDGMMLAYELLDANDEIIREAPARSAIAQPATRSVKTKTSATARKTGTAKKASASAKKPVAKQKPKR